MSGEIKLMAGAQPTRTSAVSAALLNRLVAETTLRVLRGAVTGRELAAGAVTQAKLEGAFVGEVVLRPGAVTAGKLAAGAVTAGKLADDAASAPKLAANVAGPGLEQAGDKSLQPATDGESLRLESGALEVHPKGQTGTPLGIVTAMLADGAATTSTLNAEAVLVWGLAESAVETAGLGADAVAQAAMGAGAYGAAVADVKTLGGSSTAPGEIVVESRDVSALQGLPVLALVWVRCGRATYAGGTLTLRLRHYLSEFDGGGDAVDAVLHEAVKTVSAQTNQAVLLAARVTLRNNAAVRLRLTCELGTAEGRIIPDATWAVFSCSSRQEAGT